LKATWLTVDFDDERHVPRFSGHPTRSKHEQAHIEEAELNKQLSEPFKTGMMGFEEWLGTNSHPVTLFVIADLFMSEEFNQWFSHLLKIYPERLTVGCHGLNHRSWSAWPEDKNGFSQALQQATQILRKMAGDAYRPWFRAPGGYMAPWMAPVLAEHGYTVDSSINPSWLVKRKAGKGNTWADVARALEESNVLSRPWKTSLSLPINGPALSLFPLSILARWTWKRAPPSITKDEIEQAVDEPKAEVTTLYWHLLDHAREKGTWMPPFQ
jgi:hypothetical protein